MTNRPDQCNAVIDDEGRQIRCMRAKGHVAEGAAGVSNTQESVHLRDTDDPAKLSAWADYTDGAGYVTDYATELS